MEGRRQMKIFTTILCSKCHYLYFQDEETEIQRD